MEVELTTNEVLLILLALWSIGFWICGCVAEKKRKKKKKIKAMSNIEKIRQEIERRIQSYKTKNGFPAGTISAIKIETYEGLLAFITALPEEKPTLTVEDIKTILDLSFWNNDPEKILQEYNRLKK